MTILPNSGPEGAAALSPPASWRTTALAATIIVLSLLAAYHNSFSGPFIYDDLKSIAQNPTIRRLWPIAPLLSPPADGETVGGRPLLNISLAVNYAFGGRKVAGYHVTNLLIHIAAALLLLGILRRTFLLPALRDRFPHAATPLALAITLLWAIHPLQTESVTYIIQRAESLMGMLYLLTLYCVIRGATGTVARAFWYLAAVLACLAGMATKEILVTAPVIVLLYDRTFLSGSFAEALRRRWALYLGLAATWLLLVYLVLSTGLIIRQDEMGSPDFLSYARSQPGVILHYLRLSFWPSHLCMSYDWPVAESVGAILPGTLLVGSLLAVTLWGLVRRRAYGFVGAWFFLILAPTSSFLPLNKLAHEHRMYLSLAAIAVVVVTVGYACWDRLAARLNRGYLARLGVCGEPSTSSARLSALKSGDWPRRVELAVGRLLRSRRLRSQAYWVVPLVCLLSFLVALGRATIARNAIYQSAVTVWQDSIANSPKSPMPYNNLGLALAEVGRLDEAIACYHQALQMKPDYPDALGNLGTALAATGHVDQAIPYYEEALRLKPDYAEAHNNLGFLLAGLGRIDEAMAHYNRALALKPYYAELHNNMGQALAAQGELAAAIAHYHQALRLEPDYAAAHNNLAIALTATGDFRQAIEHGRQAVQSTPNDFAAHNNLGIALAAAGRTPEAIEHFRQAVRLNHESPASHFNWAVALASLGNTDEAMEHYFAALRLNPDYLEAHENLAALLAAKGRTAEAIDHYSEVLRLRPNATQAIDSLARLLARDPAAGGNPALAVRFAELGCRLANPESAPSLDTLSAAYAAAGRFHEAIAAAERALALAKARGETALAEKLQSRLDFYRADKTHSQSQP